MDFSGATLSMTSKKPKVPELGKCIVEDGADAWTGEDHGRLEALIKKNPDVFWIIHAWDLYSTTVLKNIKRSKSWIVISVPKYGIRMLQSIAPEDCPLDFIQRANGSAWPIMRYKVFGSVEARPDVRWGPMACIGKLSDEPWQEIFARCQDLESMHWFLWLNYVSAIQKFAGLDRLAKIFSDRDIFEKHYMKDFSDSLVLVAFQATTRRPVNITEYFLGPTGPTGPTVPVGLGPSASKMLLHNYKNTSIWTPRALRFVEDAPEDVRPATKQTKTGPRETKKKPSNGSRKP